jgi:hypothetical protein
MPPSLIAHVFNRGDALARAIWVNAPVILPADGPSRGNGTRVQPEARDT